MEKGLAFGAFESNETENFHLPEVQLGPFRIENVRTTVVADGEVMNPLSKATAVTGTHIMSKNVKGIVGYEVLKHFVLTIDYKNGRMHVGLPEDLSAKAPAAS